MDRKLTSVVSVGIMVSVLAQARAGDWGSLLQLFPQATNAARGLTPSSKPTEHPAPDRAAVDRVAADRVAAAQSAYNVALAEPPRSDAPDRLCEKVAATKPGDIIGNELRGVNIGGLFKSALSTMVPIGAPAPTTDSTELLAKMRKELKEHAWLPLGVEEQIGQRILESRRAAKVVLYNESDPAARDAYAAVKPIFAAVLSETAGIQPYHTQLVIIDDGGSQPNAEALPGGIVLVNLNLAQSEPARISGYLSHEVGHIVKRHQTMALQSSLVDSMQSVSAMRKVVLSNDKSMAAELLGRVNLSGTAFTRYFSGQELEADACAGKVLAASTSLDAKDAIRMFLEDIGEYTNHASGTTAAPGSQLFREQHPSYGDRKLTLESSYRRWLVTR